MLKSHACANVTENVIGHFSVTIDCARFPLYTYYMVLPNISSCVNRVIFGSSNIDLGLRHFSILVDISSKNDITSCKINTKLR